MTTDPTTAPATVDAHTALMAALATWRKAYQAIQDGGPLDPALIVSIAGDAVDADDILAAAYDAHMATPAPATVDSADLLAQLRQAIGDTWAGPDPVSAEEARAILDAVAGVLTAAGWPANPRPARDSDQSWEMAVADVDQLTADVERLTAELHAQEGRLIGQLHVMEQRVIKAERDLAEARTREAKAVEDATRLRAGIDDLAFGWTNLAANALRKRDESDRDDRGRRRRFEAMAEVYRLGAEALHTLLADGPTPTPNTTQPIYVDHEGKPTGEPRVEVTANVHIVPAGPTPSATADAPAPGQGQDTTETQEGAQAVPAHEETPFAGDDYNGFTLTAHDAIPKGQDAVMRLTRDGALIRMWHYPAYRVWTLVAHWREFDEVNSDATPTTDATETQEADRG